MVTVVDYSRFQVPAMPSFRLLTIFYVFALLAAALGTFGPSGIFIAAVVLGFWVWIFHGSSKHINPVGYLTAFGCLGFVVLLLLPAFQSARGAAERSDCMTNLKQIQLACLVYESVNGTMPPAYLADANGKPMHSWRVLILPHFGDPTLTALYAKYNFNEPWNGPNNSKLASQIPSVYQCPSHPKKSNTTATNCHYFAVVDAASGWPGSVGRPITQFSDGTSQTIMVVEASGMGTNWMEPRDLTMNQAVNLLTTQPRSGHSQVYEGFFTRTYYETSSRNVARCDGSVYWMEQLNDPALAEALLTAAGGEVIPNDLSTKIAPGKTTVEVKWGIVWSLALFIVLALLPMASVRQKTAMQLDQPASRNKTNVQPVDVALDEKVPAI
jgi:hypothetical protein